MLFLVYNYTKTVSQIIEPKMMIFISLIAAAAG